MRTLQPTEVLSRKLSSLRGVRSPVICLLGSSLQHKLLQLIDEWLFEPTGRSGIILLLTEVLGLFDLLSCLVSLTNCSDVLITACSDNIV